MSRINTQNRVSAPGVVSTSTAGNTTLTANSAKFQRINPNGAHRDVTLPALTSSVGLWFVIANTAGAAENLVVKNAAGSTIVTLNQNESAIVACDGTTWYQLGVLTIAQS